METTATADGPPEMPDEAREDSEAGAEAFALHYIDLINYTGMHPEVGLLEPLAADSCESCANHEASVAYGAEHGDHLKGDTFVPGGPAGMFDPAGPTAVVRVPVEQPAQAYFVDDDAIDRQLSHEEATLVFRMSWSDRWRVDEITVDQ